MPWSVRAGFQNSSTASSAPPPPKREGLQAIAAEARHMTALVRDQSDQARQHRQRLQLRFQVMGAEALKLEAIDRLRSLAPERLRLRPAPSRW